MKILLILLALVATSASALEQTKFDNASEMLAFKSTAEAKYGPGNYDNIYSRAEYKWRTSTHVLRLDMYCQCLWAETTTEYDARILAKRQSELERTQREKTRATELANKYGL